MATEEITERVRELAQKCVECKVCISAREKPRSMRPCRGSSRHEESITRLSAKENPHL